MFRLRDMDRKRGTRTRCPAGTSTCKCWWGVLRVSIQRSSLGILESRQLLCARQGSEAMPLKWAFFLIKTSSGKSWSSDKSFLSSTISALPFFDGFSSVSLDRSPVAFSFSNSAISRGCASICCPVSFSFCEEIKRLDSGRVIRW